ncbi:MAG: hypothetical protein PHD97_02595 [Bacteroidales bacterium]|nr:hypothetical protein [Bacteroidales bacterium]
MKTYSLFDLVNINIHEEVPDTVIDGIDFQLNYFKNSENNAPGKSKYVIDIFSFSKFAYERNNKTIINYETEGEYGSFFVDKQNRIAIKKETNGFSIWADDSNFLITQFIQLLLLEENIFFVHSAGVVNPDNKAILFSGAGGVGKTAIIGDLIKNKGYKLLGDDIIGIKSDGTCLPFPRSFIIKEYHKSSYPELFQKLKKNNFQKIISSSKEFIRLNAPFKEVIRNYLIKKGIKNKVTKSWHSIPYMAAVPTETIFGKNSISSGSEVNSCIELVRYSGEELKIIEPKSDYVISRLNSIINFEWNNTYIQFILLGIYGMINLNEYHIKCREISSKFINKSNNLILYIPQKTTPIELSEFINKNLKII